MNIDKTAKHAREGEMSNEELKELLEWLECGDPIKDRWDETELIIDLAESLAKERGINVNENEH